MFWSNNTWADLEKMKKEFNEFFNEKFPFSGSNTFPLVNVYDKENEIVVVAELPGVLKDNINITFTDGVLILSGFRGKSEVDEKYTCVRRERATGNFKKSVEIPVNVQSDKIAASFVNGVLEVKLPKSEEAKPQKIIIN